MFAEKLVKNSKLFCKHRVWVMRFVTVNKNKHISCRTGGSTPQPWKNKSSADFYSHIFKDVFVHLFFLLCLFKHPAQRNESHLSVRIWNDSVLSFWASVRISIFFVSPKVNLCDKLFKEKYLKAKNK